MEEFKIVPRRSLIVYLRNARQARQLRRFGVVEYISEKLKYAVIAMDEADIASKKPLIERLGFVREVEVSHWPDVDTEVGSIHEGFEIVVDSDELLDEPVDKEEL